MLRKSTPPQSRRRRKMLLPPDLKTAVEGFAKERGVTREQAIALIIRDWASGNGYLAFVDED
ncbi:hypothetical protein BLJAPNOD_02376 [Ensifer sp. M14]|nr:hypothetical protein BLJAPNOD_02376 [Ensifer sp. M14]